MKLPKKLKVAVLPCPYIMGVNRTVNNQTILSGFEGIFLDIVLQALGFQYEILIPDDNEWGNLGADGQYSGLVGMVQKKASDMAFTYLTHTEPRRKAVDFSSAYTSSAVVFAIERPNNRQSKAAFLHPFGSTIWICLICTLILMSLITNFVIRDKFSKFEIFLKLFGSVLKQAMLFRDVSSRSKYLQGIWWLFAVVVSCSYSSSLLSFLTVPSQGTVISTFTELSEAVERGAFKCFTAKGSITSQYLLNSEKSELKILGNSMKDNNWYYYLKDLPVPGIVSVNSADILDRLILDMLYSSHPNIVISRESMSVFPIAFALSSDFCCHDKLNRIISKLAASGLYEKLKNDVSLKLQLSFPISADTNGNGLPLSVNNISGALIILCLGYSVSLVVLIGEILVKRNSNCKTSVIFDQNTNKDL